ncbi:hypothetical protein D3C75_1329700 [compost metagenome]
MRINGKLLMIMVDVSKIRNKDVRYRYLASWATFDVNSDISNPCFGHISVRKELPAN